MEKIFQKEMLDFKDTVNKKFEQNDIFQKEMLDFKDTANKKFEQNDIFQKEMLDFKEDMLDFQKEMLDFKEDMLDFQKDMLDFKEDMLDFQKEMLDFKEDMLDFKDKTTQTLDDIHKIVILIENELHEKVTTLFDAYSFNNDEHQVFETRLCDLENLALKNSTKISALEDITKLHSKQLAKSNS